MGKLEKNNMPNAYKEVYEVLKYVGEKERKTIPESFMNLIETKMNKEYSFFYDETKEFKDQTILTETRAILGHIYLKYWANETERSIIENKLKNDLKRAEDAKREKYDPNNIFKSLKEEVEESKDESLEDEVQDLVNVKESFISKIINLIKEFFKFNKK